jgi:predicted TIM-barrel fold metal-dependent hydrolase
LVLSAIGACSAPPPEAAAPADGPIFDHHVHLLSPALVGDWKSLGVPFSRPDSVYTSMAGLLATPRFAGAYVLSMAYLYSSAAFRQGLPLDAAQEYAAVRGENDHVAAEVRRAPDRLTGFCGVNPRRPYADRELARCRDSLGLRGVKVHLANADVDPRDPEHVEAVAAVAGWAESGGQVLLIHLDPMRPDLDIEDMEPLLRRVIDSHPRLPIVVAHLGGSGGYGEWSQQMARAVARRIAGRQGRLVLEVSGLVLERESEGVPPTTPEEAAALSADLRRIGLGNVVFGSDYPVFDPVAYQAALRERLTLTPVELDSIFANRIK